MDPLGAAAQVREPALPAAVGAELERIEGRLLQFACTEARQHLAELGEAAAARVLRTVGESRQVRTLSGFIKYLVKQERMKRNARGIPTAQSAACISGPSWKEESVSAPLYYNVVEMHDQSPNDEVASGLSNHAMVEAGSPNQQMPLRLYDNGGSVRQIARVVPDLANPTVESPYGRISSVDTPSLVCSPGHCMPSGLQNHVEIDSPIQPIISTLIRVSTPSPVRDLSRRVENMTRPSGSPPNCIWAMPQNPTAICHATANALREGPYVENTRTLLQKVVGDDNALVVNFMEKPSDTKTDFSTYCEHYHKVAEDGIVLGLRRYRFFFYKDGGKENKMKEEKRKEKNKKCTSSVRCYFVRTESGWNTDEPYILSGRTIGQARGLFMHIHTAPTLAKYMSRFALIASKTITLGVDLSTVLVELIDDKPCFDEHGNIVFRDGEPLIHTDGTGLISQDLALKCTYSISKGKLLKPQVSKGKMLKLQDIMDCDESELMGSNNTTEYPLLIQFRLFYNGSAVKGTVLVDKRLSPGTILIRPSMVKIKADPELSGAQSVNSSEIISKRNAKKNLSGVQSVNSFEIVSTSNRPRRTFTSRFLIALLHYGGVPEEFFMELLQNAIEEADNARFEYDDALNIAFNYADMEDSMSARMILSGIPLEESYLQSRLAFMAQQERKGIKNGKIPIDDCYYLMGTTDPTGKLGPSEVCVILDKGQLSGDVLVYKHPGLHFGDIHVLKATYSSDIEKVVGYSKYVIFFPTTGRRSLADEMANSDFDGDMFWVSINPKLLEHFKPSEPWVPAITQKETKQKRPQDFNEPELERLLFHEFLKTRFAPSYALAMAANSWLVYMDRLLTDSLDEIENKVIEEKMLQLVDLYYLALDAPKFGNKVNIPSDLKVKQYPHFMGRSSSYHSSSILGKIYDRADGAKSVRSEPIRISLLPCFMERDAPPAIKNLWRHRYEEYLTDSKLLCDKAVDKDERNMLFQELYEKYKHMLYDAPAFEETPRDLDDVFSEACVIYQIVYEKARSANDAARCCFAWKVAGRALCHFYALKNEGDTVVCSLPLLRNFKFIKKYRK
ncbi:hypothetical protein E2562_000599 [Oryza meyeriana var. granulata]|uniref:RNA-dependent RNA polymerase n=1 Tax=Oryza meyeriana var. granulata TaxID=110450 RepID=A0A6G1DWB1_9ORYZ|nr:hypothetical protein E2562_000599 [Oryza meyeriana var. granulata]